MNKKVKKGGDVLNSLVVILFGKICFLLLEVVKVGWFFVLNFGSCICFIFMS